MSERAEAPPFTGITDAHQALARASLDTPCRRCSECPGEQHHWGEYIEDIDDEEGDPEHPARKAGIPFWYTCKHCPAWRLDLDDDLDDGELSA